jgi:hypothetical protein
LRGREADEEADEEAPSIPERREGLSRISEKFNDDGRDLETATGVERPRRTDTKQRAWE